MIPKQKVRIPKQQAMNPKQQVMDSKQQIMNPKQQVMTSWFNPIKYDGKYMPELFLTLPEPQNNQNY